MLSVLLGFAQADTSSPLFGDTSITIHGYSFEWLSANEDSENRTDFYQYYDAATDFTRYATVTGKILQLDAATVSGTDPSGNVDGFLDQGTYRDKFEAHTSDVAGVPSDPAQNRNLTWREGWTERGISNGAVVTVSVSDSYGCADPNTSDTWATTDGNGTGSVTGAVAGYLIAGTWRINSSGSYDSTQNPAPGGNVLTIWQRDYQYSSGNWSVEYHADGTATSYSSAGYYTDAGWLSGSLDSTSGTWLFSGSDPVVGTFTGTMSSTGTATFTASPRTSPTFAGGQFYCNGVMATWLSGVVSDAETTDTYVTSNSAWVIKLGRGHLMTGDTTVVVRPAWNPLIGFQGTYEPETGVFNVAGFDIRTAPPRNPNNPVFVPAGSLWVNGTEYVFTGGYDTADPEFSVDHYVNIGAGTLTIEGAPSATSEPADVRLSWNGNNFEGALCEGQFAVEGVTVFVGPHGAPDAFWVNGHFFSKDSPGSRYYPGLGGLALILYGYSTQDFQLCVIDDTNGTVLGQGPFSVGGGVFPVAMESTVWLAYPANHLHAAILRAEAIPGGLPPGVSVPGIGVWTFLGTVGGAAYYGDVAGTGSEGLHDKTRMLSIAVATGAASRAVSLTSYTGQPPRTGTYHTQTHLFRSSREEAQRLPMPICGVDTAANNILWGLLSPPSGLPATVIAGGEVWRYSGQANGNAIYAGYYPDDYLTIHGQAGSDGSRGVSLTDATGTRTGMFRNGVFTMQSGNRLFGGNTTGTIAQTSVVGLETIAANLDITGNVLSLGSWLSDPWVAGLTLQYSEQFTLPGGVPAPVGSALISLTGSRSNTSWLWSHGNGGTGTVSAMLLSGADHALRLYDPAAPAVSAIILNPSGPSSFTKPLQLFDPAAPTVPAIILDPSGRSRFDKPIRIAPQGDLSMGEFTHGPGEP